MRGGVPSSALGARNAAHAGGRGGHVAADREAGRRNEGLPGLHEEAEGPRAGSGATVRTQVQYRKSIRKPHGCLNPAFGGKSESRGWKYARFLLPSTGSEWYLAWSQNSVRFRTDSPEEAPGSDQIALRHHAIAGTSSRRSRCGRSCARRRRQARRRSRCRRRRVGPSLEWPVKPSPLAPSRPRALAPSPPRPSRALARPVAQHSTLLARACCPTPVLGALKGVNSPRLVRANRVDTVRASLTRRFLSFCAVTVLQAPAQPARRSARSKRGKAYGTFQLTLSSHDTISQLKMQVPAQPHGPDAHTTRILGIRKRPTFLAVGAGIVLVPAVAGAGADAYSQQ